MLCVIHVVIEESPLLAWVSPNKKMEHFLSLFFFTPVDLVCQHANDQIRRVKNGTTMSLIIYSF